MLKNTLKLANFTEKGKWEMGMGGEGMGSSLRNPSRKQWRVSRPSEAASDKPGQVPLPSMKTLETFTT